jgi:uncharacterized integral membrane protein (TIGR00698 family)
MRIADSSRTSREVRFVPKAEVTPILPVVQLYPIPANLLHGERRLAVCGVRRILQGRRNWPTEIWDLKEKTSYNRIMGSRLNLKFSELTPGIVFCVFLTVLAFLLQDIERRLLGDAYLEALVLAILLGVVVRSLWTPTMRWNAGIDFSAKLLLEFAVVLLGASISAATVFALGPAMLAGIACVVSLAIASSYIICRSLGLPRRMAILIACGNSICGNSAIAAVAPIIGADSDDVASSIAFTAVLGVAVVLGLPFLVPVLSLSLKQYGVLAGLTVYAVPQVLAATLPIGALSNQVGTVVKLVRVLMLGPVVLGLSLVAGKLGEEPVEASSAKRALGDRPKAVRPGLHQLVPWFIIGFLLVAAARSLGLIPQPLLAPLASTAAILTTVSMAALGLGVNVRVVAKAGGRVTTAVTASLIVLGLISFILIRVVGVP